MRNTFFVLILFFISPQVFGQVDWEYLKTDAIISYNDLKAGFVTPPDQAKLRSYWKWMNSLVTKESITRDLEEFRKKGWGGVLINDGGNSSNALLSQDPPWNKVGPKYLSDEWKELFRHVIREAERLGMEVTVTTGSGWNPGGAFITPEYAFKKLVYSETDVKGGELIQIQLPKPDTLLMYRDFLVQAVRKPADDSPLKEDAIKNWTIKTFNKSLGWAGIYPLYKLRETYRRKEDKSIIKIEDILDVTQFFDGHTLTWNAPEGEWVIIRYGYTCTGRRTSTTSQGYGGLTLDHLNPEAFQIFAKHVIIPLIETAQSAGSSLKYLLTDSWEMGVMNWTNRFPEEFERFRGYKLNDYLPVLTGRVVESREVTNRFLHDFRKTVHDCIAENHYKPFAELAHQYGLGFHPESGGPHAAPIDAMQIMQVNDFPQGEFWIRSNSHRTSDAARFSVRQSACVAHTNGKRIVAAEGPQCIGPKWERAPKDMKHDLDRAFCSGVNRLFWTNSISSPQEFGVPGLVNFAANQLNPNITWWDQAGDFIRYINRSCFMLQQGLFAADVLYYYGDDVPNFVFLKEEYPELQYGYDWDKCSKDVILNRTSVSDGKIVLPDGMSYRVLVLTPEEAIDLKVLKKVEQLVKQGATVISPRPVRTTGLTNYPECDAELNDIAKRLWGKIDGKKITENRYGKGRVIWGKDINQVLRSQGIDPDFSFESKNEKTTLDYIHRKMKNLDVYFVVNRFAYHSVDDFKYHYIKTLPDRYEEVVCAFRVTGKVPELWDPISGTIKKIAVYHESGGKTYIPMHLDPEGSVFVVFRDKKQSDHVVRIEKVEGKPLFPFRPAEVKADPAIDIYWKNNEIIADVYESGNYQIHWASGKHSKLEIEETGKELEISGPWTVHFDPKWGGPEKEVFQELKSWIDFDKPEIKYYSGKATYLKSFKIRKQEIKNKKVFLDLGLVQELAVVRLNGHTFPVDWMPPFKVDISKYLTIGENKLEVVVINQWPNRLIGDGKLPVDQRIAKTNYLKFYAPDADKYLRESGLMGPVKLQFVGTVQFK